MFDHLQYRKPDKGKPKTAWLIAAPCTGSTWLTRMLGASFRWHVMWPLPKRFARREQDVHITRQFDACKENIFIPQMHTKWNEVSQKFISDYKVRPIIITRDLFDNALSVRDHMVNIGVGLPTGFTPPYFKELPFNDQMEIVIRIMMPWHLSFYASWAWAEATRDVKICYVDYNELVANPLPELARCLAHLSETRSATQLQEAIDFASDPTLTRFNKGIVGRGHTDLNKAHKAALMALFSCEKEPRIRASLERVNPSRYAKITKLSTPGRKDDAGGSMGVQEAKGAT